VVPALVAFWWAVYEVLLALVTVAVVGFTVASFVLVVRCRTLPAYGCVLAQVPLFFACSAVGGGAASCLIG